MDHTRTNSDQVAIQTRIIELPRTSELPAHGQLETVIVHIPLIHNPNWLRIRIPIWIGKVLKSIGELQACVSGMNLSLKLGWDSEGQRWDPHVCVDFDTEITDEFKHFL